MIQEDYIDDGEERAGAKTTAKLDVLERAGLICPAIDGISMKREKPGTTFFGDPEPDKSGPKGEPVYSHVCGDRYRELLGDHVGQVTLGEPAQELIDLAGLMLKRKSGNGRHDDKIDAIAEGLTWKTKKKQELLAVMEEACDQFIEKWDAQGRSMRDLREHLAGPPKRRR